MVDITRDLEAKNESLKTLLSVTCFQKWSAGLSHLKSYGREMT